MYVIGRDGSEVWTWCSYFRDYLIERIECIDFIERNLGGDVSWIRSRGNVRFGES